MLPTPYHSLIPVFIFCLLSCFKNTYSLWSSLLPYSFSISLHPFPIPLLFLLHSSPGPLETTLVNISLSPSQRIPFNYLTCPLKDLAVDYCLLFGMLLWFPWCLLYVASLSFIATPPQSSSKASFLLPVLCILVSLSFRGWLLAQHSSRMISPTPSTRNPWWFRYLHLGFLLSYEPVYPVAFWTFTYGYIRGISRPICLKLSYRFKSKVKLTPVQ